MNKRDDEGAAANSGVLFFLRKVFYVNWKCDTDGGGFVAVDGGLHEGEATPDHYAESGWKERGEMSDLGFKMTVGG